MKITYHKSYFALKPHIVKFSKAVDTMSFHGHGLTGGDLYLGKASRITYCFVFHFLWLAVKFNMEETEGWCESYYEKQKQTADISWSVTKA